MSKVISFKGKEKELNFKVYARNVAEGKMEEATRVLRDLLRCDFEEAQKITDHFKRKFDQSPQVMMQMMAIKSLLEQGQKNEVLFTIQELFGVSGPMSLQIFQVMNELV